MYMHVWLQFFLCTEATSKPKFADSERRTVMNQFDPVTLHVLQTDETTKRAVQLFARQVVLILHTCNVNEYWAALERLEPPTKEDENEIRGRRKRCHDELTTTLTKSFPITRQSSELV